MSKQHREYLVTRDTAFWLKHLCDENSDWASNLILYYLFDKDASKFIIYDRRKKWLKIKKEDVEYWKKFLSSRQRGQYQ